MEVGQIVQEYVDLLDSFWKASPKERWLFNFPIAVFGTLRKGRGNHPLMGSLVGQPPVSTGYRRSARYHHYYYTRGFVPHLTSTGIHVSPTLDASAPFEVYCYDKDNWNEMIDPVDSLEGFNRTIGQGWYQRTLAFVHLLECDSCEEVYKQSLSDTKSCGIDPSRWDDYAKLPCWIYSSLRTNKSWKDIAGSPFIWDGTAQTTI